MTPKVFETLFRITAQWKGQAAVSAAQAGIGRVGRAAQTASVKVKGLTGAVFRGDIAARAFSRAVSLALQGLTKSITAAAEAQEAHDDLGLSLERNARFYSELAGKSMPEMNKILEANRDALIKQAEQMEKTGIDAETLEAGWAKMLDALAFSPEQMKQNAKAFSDVLSFWKNANVTAEDSIQLGEEWSATILQGNPAFLKRVKAERGYLNLLRQINIDERKGNITAEEAIKRRRDLSIRAAKQVEGETERVARTRSGKIRHMWVSIENLFENLGKPFIDRSPELAESIDKISVGLGPTSEKLALISDTYLKDIGNWLAEHKDSLPNWIDRIGTALEMTFKPLTLTYELLKKMYDLWEKMKPTWGGVPARLPQLPGAPPSMPTGEGAAGTQGEAARRAAEGRSFYKEGYPSALPGKIGTPSASLQSQRQRIADELMNPRVANLLKASTMAEVGDQSESAKQAYIESVMNRSLARNKTLAATLSDPNYYPAATRRKLGRTITGSSAQQLDRLTASVLAGSNISNLATGNESLGVRSGGAKVHYNPGTGERFVGELRDVPWINRTKASLKDLTSALGPRSGGGGGTTNNSMSAPITINGVAPGREYAVGRQVRSAIQAPMREFLDQIKAARNYESRLGYV